MFFQTQDVIPLLFQVAFGLILFFLEKTGKFQLAYSKFRKGGNLNAKFAMFLIYFPAPIAYVAGSMSGGLHNSFYHDALFYAFLIHFWKRCGEILFLHKYSKPMGFGTVLLIGTLYSAVAWTAAILHASIPTEIGNAPGVRTFVVIGGIVFLIGQAGNFYHHWLLASLRSDGSSGYKTPEGGLFTYVVCPHYLFEIIAWIGIALMSGFLPVLGIASIMALYLLGRSIKTLAWYKENVPGFPDRKALIPGLI
ncbi:MAG: 3-oxo-5-alpha-steroid 4-dehydrogenase [Spirochaetia bacterium]|nr:3-oxo-5-alpha-steroid 4-dehydrogenase [Spirochaetia bacterium]